MKYAVLVHPGSVISAMCDAVEPPDPSAMAEEFLSFPNADRAVVIGGMLDEPLVDIPRPLRNAVYETVLRVNAEPDGKQLEKAGKTLCEEFGVTSRDSVLVCGGWADPDGGCSASVARGIRKHSGATTEMSEYAFFMDERPAWDLCESDLAAAKRIAALGKDKLAYGYLVENTGSGPLDGGCYVFARACRDRIGAGMLAILHGREAATLSRLAAGTDDGVPALEVAHHFVLKIGKNAYLDAEGISTFGRLKKRWRSSEGVDVTRIEECPSDAEALAAAVRMLATTDEGVQNELRDILWRRTERPKTRAEAPQSLAMPAPVAAKGEGSLGDVLPLRGL